MAQYSSSLQSRFNLQRDGPVDNGLQPIDSSDDKEGVQPIDSQSEDAGVQNIDSGDDIDFQAIESESDDVGVQPIDDQSDEGRVQPIENLSDDAGVQPLDNLNDESGVQNMHDHGDHGGDDEYMDMGVVPIDEKFEDEEFEDAIVDYEFIHCDHENSADCHQGPTMEESHHIPKHTGEANTNNVAHHTSEFHPPTSISGNATPALPQEVTSLTKDPIFENDDHWEPFAASHISLTFVALMVGYLLFFCWCIGLAKRKRREKKKKMDVYSCLRHFDIDDVDLRKSITGGYHVTYRNDLKEGKHVDRSEHQIEFGFMDEYDLNPATSHSLNRYMGHSDDDISFDDDVDSFGNSDAESDIESSDESDCESDSEEDDDDGDDEGDMEVGSSDSDGFSPIRTTTPFSPLKSKISNKRSLRVPFPQDDKMRLII